MGLYWLLVIPAYIFFDAAFAYYSLTRIYARYVTWLQGDKNSEILQERTKLINLINKAGINNDTYIPTAQPIGYSQVATCNANVLDNFPSRRKDFAVITYRIINDALGVYKHRMWSVFNPLWWIDKIIFLPSSLAAYLGFDINRVAVKISNIIWWIVSFILTILSTIYPDQFRRFFDRILQSLML